MRKLSYNSWQSQFLLSQVLIDRHGYGANGRLAGRQAYKWKLRPGLYQSLKATTEFVMH
jgi:hypothetical protein